MSTSPDLPWITDWALPLADALAALSEVPPIPALSALAAHLGCDPAQLALASGYAELILAARLTALPSGERVVMPTAHPWRRFFPNAVDVPHTERGRLDLAALLSAAMAPGTSAVIVGSPDPVTGATLSRAEVTLILDSFTGLLIVDGSYHEFAPDFLGPMALQDPRLLVIRPLTLLSQAAPVAYAISHATRTAPLQASLAPLPLLLHAAIHAWLGQGSRWQSSAAQTVTLRQALYRGLLQIPGLHVFPSQANFLCLQGSPEQMAALEGEGFPVRSLPYNGSLAGCWQLAIPDPERAGHLHQRLLIDVQNQPAAG